MRVVWTLVLAGVAWWVWRRWVAARVAREDAVAESVESSAGPAPSQSLPPARMVRCAQCGVHLPELDAVFSHGRHYCSAAHRDAAERVA